MRQTYFLKECISKADEHCKRFSEKNLEALGLLIGKFYSHKGKNWVLVEDYITAGNNSTSASVRFTKEAFQQLARQYNEKQGKVIVGWCHSHPGYGCFLSTTDSNTQNTFFDHALNIALVIDPTKTENNHFLRRVYRVENEKEKEISFAVIKKRD
ncbi:MAG: Mov34/MPN/PAD-1 family protein [Candidatus Micrarchaeia archaeon]